MEKEENKVNEMNLKKLTKFLDDMGRGSFVLVTPQGRVRLDDISELVGQVVLSAHRGAHDNGRTHWGRRNREDGDDHKFRTSILIVKSEIGAILLRDALKDLQRLFGHQGSLPIFSLPFPVLELRKDFCRSKRYQSVDETGIT
jgi:hypothetical protein